MFCASLASPTLRAASALPSEVVQQGYTVNTFSSNFTTATVDIKNTRTRGFNWYIVELYYHHADPAGIKINGDGTVTLNGDTSGASGQLMSALHYKGTNTFAGTTFGGGAYFEAEFKFDPTTVASAHTAGIRGWPAFWGLPLEGAILPYQNQWKGAPSGYQHTVETDFFEADTPLKPTSYGIGLHDWYGISGQTCPHGLCVVNLPQSGERTPPLGTDFTQFHRYGFLWVPASATSSGFMQGFFDGQPIGASHSWTLFQDQAPPPTGQSWAFGRLDQQHQFIILGSGLNQPFTVRSVNVWQHGSSANLAH
jgi:hypothetical protein